MPTTQDRSGFWLANVMTLVRVPLAGALWVAPHSVAWLLGLFVVAGVTDILDGRIARWATSRPGVDEERRLAQARLGAWLDPLCDKAFMVSALLALAVHAAPPVHLAVLVVLRELALAPLLVVYLAMPEDWRHRHLLTADWSGKITTGLQAAALLALLLRPQGFAPLAWAAGLCGAFSVVHYVHRARRDRVPGPAERA